MSTVLTSTSSSGETIHYSVGAIIRKSSRFLLIERATPPEGFASIAGHVDEGESPQEAVVREVKEESGLKVTLTRLLFEETLSSNWCNKGAMMHRWFIFQCDVKGYLVPNRESRSLGWYTAAQIRKLELEPSWTYWFKKLGVL